MRKIVSLIFVFILVLPIATWLIGLNFGININKIGVEFPKPYGRVLLENEYYLAFDQYFNDNFSLRGPLIFAKNWLDLHVFRTTDATDVYVGRDGWLYSRESIEDYQNEACDDDMDIEWMVLKLHALEKIIGASGRRLFFIIAPNKATIYPEFIGLAPMSNACGHRRYDLVLDSTTLYPLEGFVRLDEVLRAAKKNHALLYDRATSDWNGLGAMVAAETLLRQISDGDFNLPSLDYISIDDAEPGDLKSRLLGLAPRVEDQPLRHFSGSSRPESGYGIVYGDFFLRNFIPYLTQMFKQLDVVQADRIPSVGHNENLRTYDYILIETSESELENLRIDFDGIYSLLEAEAVIPERTALDLRALMPVSQCSLNLRPDGLEIKSLGAQSAFEIKSVPASDEISFRVLKLLIETSQPDLMTIKYLTGRQYVAKKPFKAGLAEVYLPLPYQKSISLRFHPSMRAGLFILRSAEILGFPKIPGIEEPIKEELSVAAACSDDDVILKNKNPDSKVSNSQTDAGIAVGSSDADSNDMRSDEIPSENAFTSEKKVTKGAELEREIDMFITDAKIISDKELRPALSDDAKQSPANEPSIAVADFEDGRIFQRKDRSAKIVVTGTYTGVIDGVEARVIRDGSSEEIVPWTLIDKSPKNGIFVGVIPNVAQGGWYNVQVRDSINHAVSDRGLHRWGVGILVACLGQSNMKEWFYTGTLLNAHELLRKFTDDGWSEIGNQGHAAIAFGNRIIERVGVPVGLLDYSKNGSGLRKEADWGTGYWENTAPGSIYSRFLKGVRQIGGVIEFLVWIQGEADAARGTVSEQEYAASLKSFITNQVRADIKNGSEREHLPFLIVMMVKRPGGKDEPHQAIRNAQKYVTETVAECYLAATTLDLKNQGKQHLSPHAYIAMGRRVSQTVLYILGQETYYRGPTVSAVKKLDDKTIDVRLQHKGGTDFIPVTGITGWEVIENGSSVPIGVVYRYAPQTIRLILKQPIADKVEIHYLYGAMPNAANPVLDNSAMSLPLEEYHSEIGPEK